MFDKLKQIHQLKKIQDEVKKETVTVEKQGVAVTMRGDFEVTSIQLNSELAKEDQERVLLTALTEAKEAIQKKLAQSFSGLLS
jgi:DNA-binding protein YbaB